MSIPVPLLWGAFLARSAYVASNFRGERHITTASQNAQPLARASARSDIRSSTGRLVRSDNLLRCDGPALATPVQGQPRIGGPQTLNRRPELSRFRSRFARGVLSAPRINDPTLPASSRLGLGTSHPHRCCHKLLGWEREAKSIGGHKLFVWQPIYGNLRLNWAPGVTWSS